jgi:hypothetical protein
MFAPLCYVCPGIMGFAIRKTLDRHCFTAMATLPAVRPRCRFRARSGTPRASRLHPSMAGVCGRIFNRVHLAGQAAGWRCARKIEKSPTNPAKSRLIGPNTGKSQTWKKGKSKRIQPNPGKSGMNIFLQASASPGRRLSGELTSTAAKNSCSFVV